MNRFIAMLLTVISIVITASSCTEKPVEDTPVQRKVLAIEVVRLMLSSGGFESAMNLQMNLMADVFAASSKSDKGSEMSQAEYSKLQIVLRESFAKTFPMPAWEEPMAELYVKYFTAPELEQMLKFYRSPSGTKNLQLQGQLTTEGAKIGERLYESRRDEFAEAFGIEANKRKLGQYAASCELH